MFAYSGENITGMSELRDAGPYAGDANAHPTQVGKLFQNHAVFHQSLRS